MKEHITVKFKILRDDILKFKQNLSPSFIKEQGLDGILKYRIKNGGGLYDANSELSYNLYDVDGNIIDEESLKYNL